jgi:hypothetical protein
LKYDKLHPYFSTFTSIARTSQEGNDIMANAELKTRPTGQSVQAFIDAIPDERKRQDSQVILELMKKATNAEPKMWGESIVGFGDYHYHYKTGREGDWFLAGFSPRKQNLTLYIMAGFDQYDDLMAKLGKYKTGKSCLYINKLVDLDQDVLAELVKKSAEHIKQTNP